MSDPISSRAPYVSPAVGQSDRLGYPYCRTCRPERIDDGHTYTADDGATEDVVCDACKRHLPTSRPRRIRACDGDPWGLMIKQGAGNYWYAVTWEEARVVMEGSDGDR